MTIYHYPRDVVSGVFATAMWLGGWLVLDGWLGGWPDVTSGVARL